MPNKTDASSSKNLSIPRRVIPKTRILKRKDKKIISITPIRVKDDGSISDKLKPVTPYIRLKSGALSKTPKRSKLLIKMSSLIHI